MSSPAENTLREQMCKRPVLTSIAVDQLQVHQKDVSYLGVVSENYERSSKLVDSSLAMILGRGKKPKKKPSMSVKKLESKLREYFDGNKKLEVAVVENSSIRKMLAKVCLASDKELEACCHLISSHATCLRQQIFVRFLKSKLRAKIFQQPLVKTLDPLDLDFIQNSINTNPKLLLPILRELPTEWYVLQVTAEHEHLKNVRHSFQQEEYMYSLRPTHGLHLIVMPTGANAMEPICITVPKPNLDSTYDLRTEIEKLLNNNKSDLTAVYSNKDLYWKMRKKQNEQMSIAIWELEYSWLREWRVLLQADPTEHLDLVQDIHNMIDKLIADASVKNISERTRWLLKKIATGACHLKTFEIERAVKYVLPTETKLAKNIILSIVAKAKVMDRLKDAKRKTLLLILDECLDHISFESVHMLKHQAVTRFPSLYLLYALFKQHKSSIKDGYKIIHHTDNIGTFIVNPSMDLMHMEVRIRSFLDYWLPKWKGLYGIKPDIEFFKAALTKHDILMYNGHGSGIQFVKGEEIERMRVLATVMLFGCGSIKLLPIGGRQPSFGISNQYLMACSPCILGMLWEVTDGDIDRMTAEFISKWIPSKAKKPWSDVSETLWYKGKLDPNKDLKSVETKIPNEQNMLIAVAKSKDVCKQYMTSAAIIVRGLPVKLVH